MGIMRIASPLLVSRSSTAIWLTATTIAVILLAANFTITNAQQLTSQPTEIQNGTLFQNIDDSIRVQVPQGWVIHDVKNAGIALGVEILQGYGILAQLCPEEEQPQQQQQGATALPIADGNTSSSSSSSNNCQGSEEVIHVIRYPNLGGRLGFDSGDIISNNNSTTNAILAYQLQKLQEVGYSNIHIVNSTDTTINVDISTGLNNNITTIAAAAATTVPAKLVEMTYSTNLAPDETRRGYFISTATDAAPRNLGMMTGYGIFYEGIAASHDAQQEQTMLPSGILLASPTPVGQVFDSFEIVASPEVAAVAAEASQTAQTEDPDTNEEDNGDTTQDEGADNTNSNDNDDNDDNDDASDSNTDENRSERNTDEDSECGGVTVGGTSAADDYGCGDPDAE